MRKNLCIIAVSIILIILVIYFGTSYHFMYNSVCGTGLTGLKLVGEVTIITLLAVVIIILLDKRDNKSRQSHCLMCNASIQDDWIICPYCGSDRIGGR